MIRYEETMFWYRKSRPEGDCLVWLLCHEIIVHGEKKISHVGVE